MQILLSVLLFEYLGIANAAMLDKIYKVVSQNTWPQKSMIPDLG